MTNNEAECGGPLSPGEVVADRYEVVRRLGQGGLADVYLVNHRDLKQWRALKLCCSRSPMIVERMVQEGRIQAQLRHPSIVRVTDVVRHRGHAGLVMDYVKGPTLLEHLLQAGRQTDGQVRDLFAPLLGAVHHAHLAGVLHRDLKPSNVLLAPEADSFRPRVTDFGIAKVLESVGWTRLGQAIGTPGYMAPEQVRGAADVDRRVDVFALGLLLFELVAGQPAYGPPEALSPTTTLERPPPSLKDVVPDAADDLVAAVARATALDPDDRFEDCMAFARALGLGGHPSLAPLPDPTTLGQTPPRPTLLPPSVSGPTLQPDSRPSHRGGPRIAWSAGAALVATLSIMALPSTFAPNEVPAPVEQAVAAPAPEPAEATVSVVTQPMPDPVPVLAPRPVRRAARSVPKVVAPQVLEVMAPQAEPPPTVMVVRRATVEVEPVEPVEPEVRDPAPPMPTGRWRGRDPRGRSLELEVLRSSPDGALEVEREVPVGLSSTRMRLRGRVDPESGLVTLQGRQGASFRGKWNGAELVGTLSTGPQRVSWRLAPR